jgi:signal transduction histidine kinase
MRMTTDTPSILVIDDEVGMREGCRRVLAPHGYSVSTAEHGAEGLRKLRGNPFDLVLLDAMMPGMSGLELLERIRQHDPDVMCVMITGYATVDLAAQAMKQGAQSFLPKPFTSDELLTAVQGGLVERSRRLEARRQKEREEESRELERARREMATLDAIESRFMLVVVHELRNPAGVIKNYLQLMRKGYVDEDEFDDYLLKLDRRASQLLDMLDDLLELAHLKARQEPTKLELVPIAEVVEEVVEKARPAAEAKGLELVAEIETRPVMMAQRSDLQSLWTELVKNAVQYTPDGRVRVSLEEGDGTVTSRVEDTGIGITEDELTRIFEEFYRADPAKSEQELGTGLGLDIVNQIVTNYHGSIRVESTPGVGSTFSLSLPAQELESDVDI